MAGAKRIGQSGLNRSDLSGHRLTGVVDCGEEDHGGQWRQG
jgi:hypothetical protein